MPIEARKISDSRLIYGCMGLGGEWNDSPLTADDVKKAEAAVEAALSIGITMFDHADIYRNTKAESVFGEVLKNRPDLREKIVLQSKCGIRFEDEIGPGRYDFSKEHILKSVDGSIDRLGVDQLDVLLLHRPDPLMEPEVVAEAFSELLNSGKVKNFGVSNMNAAQIDFLQRVTPAPLVVNQIEMSLAHLHWVDHGVLFNQDAGTDVNFASGTLEYCRREDIQLQAWSPLARGLFSGRSTDGESDAVKKTADLVKEMADKKGTTREAIVLAWLMRHPAMIQPVIGTSNPDRIEACKDAENQADKMTREEWYQLYVSARGVNMP